MAKLKEGEIEERIIHFLIKLKKDKPEFYESTKRILVFIYTSVKKDYFNEKKANWSFKNLEKRVRLVEDISSKLFECYVECENGIIDNLFKICSDADDRYFNKLFVSIEPFLEMVETGIYSDYNIYKYLFNLYVMLKGYECRRDDYKTFCDIVDDVSKLFISSNIYVSEYSSYSDIASLDFIKKKVLIDVFVGFKKYSYLPKIRDNFKLFLDEINYDYADGLISAYIDMFNKYNALYSFVDEFSSKEIVLSNDVVEKIENNIFQIVEDTKFIENGHSSYRHILTGNYLNYFNKILLCGERYQYIVNKLDEVEGNFKLKEDILNYLKEFDIEMFESLSELCDSQGDSFIYCMDLVFDSDTYYEMKSKLDALVGASKQFKEEKKISLNIIKDLKSPRHKEVIDGKVMTFSKDKTMNRKEKPKKICERMIEVHKTSEYAPDENYYYSLFRGYYGNDLGTIVRKIQQSFASNKKAALEAEAKRLKELEEQALQQKAEEEAKKPKGLGSLFNRKSGS